MATDAKRPTWSSVKPARRMLRTCSAAFCRARLSLSAPTFVAELVRSPLRTLAEIFTFYAILR